MQAEICTSSYMSLISKKGSNIFIISIVLTIQEALRLEGASTLNHLHHRLEVSTRSIKISGSSIDLSVSGIRRGNGCIEEHLGWLQ